MADPLEALSSAHARDPVITDSYLFTLGRFGDPTALVELWNRYYTTAYLAAEKHASKKRPASEIVTSSFDHWLDHTEKRTHSDAFMADWFADIPAPPPTPLHRAVLWAFYAMTQENRTIVWRHTVDRWTADQITAELKLPPGGMAPMDRAEGQFATYLGLAAAALHLPENPPEFVPPGWRALLISSMLGTSTDVYDELGARIPSPDVISPPGSPQPLFTPASNDVQLSTVLRVASIVVVAVALAVIGVLGLTRWSRTSADQPTEPEVLTPSASTRTPAPILTPSQEPSPTPAETPEEVDSEAAAEPDTQTYPQNYQNPGTTRTTSAAQTDTGPQTNPNPPAPPPDTTEPADGGDTDTGGGGGDDGSDTGGTGGTDTGGTDTGGGGDTGADDTGNDVGGAPADNDDSTDDLG